MPAIVPRSVVLAALVLCSAAGSAADTPLPRFTEEREAAALHFVRKHCPELVPMLDELKKSNRPAYEQQVRETFQVTELLADLQDEDPKRYELELKIWVAENKALVLGARLATAKEERLLTMVRDLVWRFYKALKGYKQNPFFRHQWKYYDVARP